MIEQEDNNEQEPINMETFSDAVILSEKVGRYKGMKYKDIILGLCEDYNIEIEEVPSLINQRVRRRLEIEELEAKTVKGRINKNRLF